MEKARDFYAHRLDSLMSDGVTKSLMPAGYVVHWEDAISGSRAAFEAIEVPISSEKDYTEVIAGKTVQAIKRVLVAEFTKTGVMGSYIMTIIPTPDYEQSNPDYASHVGHSSDNIGFSGMFIYNSLRGDFVKIVVWYEGVQTGSFYTPMVTVENYEYVSSNVARLMHSVGKPLTKRNDDGPVTGNNTDGYCFIHAVVITPDHPRECSIPYPGGYPPMMEPDPEDGGGGGGGGTPGLPWPKYLHDILINTALNMLSTTQKELVKIGSNNADGDKYQTVQYNHMHSMRQPGQSVAQAITSTKEYFIEQVKAFKNTGNYTNLGMALHPIMDAYAPPHRGFQTFDGTWVDFANHVNELIPGDIGYIDAIYGTKNVCSSIINLPNNPTNASIQLVFYKWLSGYTKF